MCLCDLFAEIQSESGALCFSGGFVLDAVEPIEDPFALSGWNTRTLIDDLETDRSSIFGEVKVDRSLTRRIFLGVLEQIVDQDLQQQGVSI